MSALIEELSKAIIKYINLQSLKMNVTRVTGISKFISNPIKKEWIKLTQKFYVQYINTITIRWEGNGLNENIKLKDPCRTFSRMPFFIFRSQFTGSFSKTPILLILLPNFWSQFSNFQISSLYSFLCIIIYYIYFYIYLKLFSC